jgi:phage FluMu protein Com
MTGGAVTQSTAQPYTNQYYSHSGQVPPAGLFAGVVVGAVAAIVGGVAYGYADHYLRFIYLHVVMTFAFGALLGWAPARAMLTAKVRNAGAVVLLSLLTALAGYYVAWIAWLCALYQDVNIPISATRLVASPHRMYRIILRLNELGVWGMDRGSPVKGELLWSVWLIEAAIIFATAVGISRKIARKRPFCENCGRWAAGPLGIASTSVLDAADLKQRLESRQYDFVPQLPRFGGIAGEYLAWEYYQCPACKEFNALIVTRIQMTRDKRGRTRKVRRAIIDKLILSASDVARLQAKPPPPPPPPSRPAPRPVTKAAGDFSRGPFTGLQTNPDPPS